jgi:hypothetical protein
MNGIITFYQEFETGDNEMNLTEKSKQTSFSENGDDKKSLFKKVLEIMDNPPEVDQYGRKWEPLSMSLGQHFEYVLAKYPELQINIDKKTYQNWVNLIRPFLSISFCEHGSPGNILQRETLEICFEKGCSFSEAFSEACLRYPHIAKWYVEYGYK